MRFKRIITVFIMCVMVITNLTADISALMNEDCTHYTFSQAEKYWLKNPYAKFNIEYASDEYNGKQVCIEGKYHGEEFSYFLPVSDYMVAFYVWGLLDIMSYQYNTEIKAEGEPEIQLTTDDIEFTGISAANGASLVYISIQRVEPNITSEYDFSEAEQAVVSEGDINIFVECGAESETDTDTLSIAFAGHFDLYTLQAEYSFPAEEGGIDVDIDNIISDMCDYYNTVLKEPEESNIVLSAEDVEMVQIIGLEGTVIKDVTINRRHQINSYSQSAIPGELDGYLNIIGDSTPAELKNIQWNSGLWNNAVLGSPKDILNKENDSDYMIVVKAELEEEPKIEFDKEKSKWLIQLGTSSWYVNRAESAVLMSFIGHTVVGCGNIEKNVFDIVMENGKTSYIYALNAEDMNAADDDSWLTLLQMGNIDTIKLTVGYAKIPESSDKVEFTYTENYDGTLTVTGHNRECSKLVIPGEINGKQVTVIGAGAFSFDAALREAVIPNSVETIEERAFEGCRALKNVDIPDSVQYIQQMAFKDCVILSSVELPDKVDRIDNDLFRNCFSLKSVTANGARGIMFDAFNSCVSLVSFNIPDSVEYIGAGAFQYCSSLEAVVIPEGVTEISFDVFEYCSSLKSVEIPKSVTKIEITAFGHCSSLESVKIPYGMKRIEMRTFEYCNSLRSVEIPNSVTSIGQSAFEYCTSLESLNIPDSVEVIEDWAFGGCSSLRSAAVPESVTDLGHAVFAECSSLISAKLPDNGIIIGEGIFRNCTSLEIFEFPKNITTIPPAMFEGCVSLSKVILPESLTAIEQYSFANCTALASIDIPDSVIKIEGNSFSESGLRSVRLPKGMTMIEGNTFYMCRQLESVYLPDSVTVVDGDAFRATALVSVELPDSVTTIGRCAFAECLSLTSVVIPESVIDIDLNVFAMCPYYLTIYGYTNSPAEAYANENWINFVSLDYPGQVQIDGETGVEVSSENTDDNSLDGKNLEVEKTESTESSITFNITLTDEKGNETQPAKPVTISIPLPSKWDGDIAFVYRREANGKYTDMRAVIKDGRLVFTTNHFSEYIVTTEKLVTVTLADINSDGKITTVDAKWVLQYVSGSRTLTDEQIAAADVNGDGKITTVDAKWILQTVSGSRVLD